MGKEIVSMKKINKRFPGVQALSNVDFNLHSGEVVFLMGENGAGKSTLMNILNGVHQRDSGEIEIFGEKVFEMDTKKANDLGISMIHQELNMCNDLTVAENIFLGREIIKNGVLSREKMRSETKKILKKLKSDIKPNDLLGNLPVSQQQIVEIAKALSMDSKILIMDEPTSALAENEVETLFEIIRGLKSEGHGIIYISHKMDELLQLADRVIIMRDGEYITSDLFKNLTVPKIISHMVGREITEQFPNITESVGDKIMEVTNISNQKLKNINLALYAGEIVGISGLMGSGRSELTRTIFGADYKESGQIYLDNKKVEINSPQDAIKAGIVLAPEDRKNDGLCTKLSVQDNISLPNIDKITNSIGVIIKKKEKELVKNTVTSLNIKTPNNLVDAGSLSGGNQQKIVVGKWLARDSRVVIFDEPTRGIDVGAKVAIYELMNELKRKGIAVMFVSSELPEILGMSDRILVMNEGQITGELSKEEATQDKIMTLATQN